MEAIKTAFELDTDVMDRTLIDPEWRNKPMYAWDDVLDGLCKDLGKHYGVKDIRDVE